MLNALDHLIVGVRDLAAAEAATTRLLGREPSWRGAHPGAGTANVLYRLDNTYLELLAPEGEGGAGRLLGEHLEARGEGLLGLAFATDDAEAWLDTAHLLQARFSDLDAIAHERRRITDAVIEALESCLP